MLAPWKEGYENLDKVLKRRDISLQQKSVSQSYDFSYSHVWM